MRMITSIPGMQLRSLRWEQQGVRIGFVPTMGYLHEGHLSLVRRARRAVGRNGKVVVSIYVNPTQFSPKEDLSKYPRDLKRDLSLCRKVGVDLVFAPSDVEMYPGQANGHFSTHVVEESLSRYMEGRSRPTHFRGVTTVVAKLFNIVRPQVAIFGAKDWQQAGVVRRMTRDLNLRVRIIVAPIVRESDGLAMSSRNKYLTPDQRQQATVLWRALQLARKNVRARAVSASRLRKAVQDLIATAPEARLDYVEFFDGDSLVPVRKVCPGTHMALAVFIGESRLIDNGRL